MTLVREMDVLSLESSEASIPEILSIVEMTPGEAAASMARKVAPSVQSIQVLKARHHQAAKLFAAGFKRADVARKTGYAPTTLDTLKCNPAFKDLIEHYNGEFQESMSELHDRMEALSMDLIAELETRMDNDGTRKDISIPELKELLTSMLDRTGRGPIKKVERHSRSESLNVSIIQRVREVASEKRFDLGEGNVPVEVLPLPPDRRLGVGTASAEGSLGPPETPDGSQETGTVL